MNNNTKEELDARRKEFVIQQKKLMIKFILFLLVVISVILMYQLLSYNKESKKQEIKSLDQQSQEINQEIGVFRAFAHQFVHIAQVVRRVGLGDLRIESGHEIVGELGYRTLEFDGHIPRRIDLHAEKQVHQDIDSLGVEDEEPVPDKGPPGEGGHLPRNPFFDQPGAEPAFLELTLGVDAVQDPDD